MRLLGVPINQSKSIVCTGPNLVIEFAKRTSIRSQDVSPVSWKMILSQDTFNGRLAVVRYLADKGFSSINRIFNIVLAQRVWDVRPLKDGYSGLALLTSYAKSGKLDLDFLLRFLLAEGMSVKRGRN
jgi:hypothetical protein